MFKGRHLNIEKIIAVLLFSAVCSERKPDFAILTACVSKNQSLRVDCSYPHCDSSFTPFKCEMYDVEGNTSRLIASSNWEMVNSNVSYLNATSGICRFIIKDYATIYRDKTKIYTCHLSRKKSKEVKTLTVKYNGTRKERPKACTSGGPFLLVSGLLWSIAFLSTYL